MIWQQHGKHESLHIQQVLADLGSGQFYAEMLATATQSAMDRIVDSLL
jgi:hypothetical protein